MGSCYSSLASWYSWALGPTAISTGLPRFPGDSVDGEALVDLLVEADPDVLECGQGTTILTEPERVSLQAGRYDEIVYYSASDNVELRQKDREERLRREEEAGYEARREQARSARQAQSIEASRAAATAVAVAQATNLALRQNGDMFISAAAPLPSGAGSPITVRSTEAAASSDSAASTADVRAAADGVAPLSLNGLRSEPKLDAAKAQLHAFEQSTQKSSTKRSPPTAVRPKPATATAAAVLTASSSTVGVQRQPVLTNHSHPRLMQREPPPLSDAEPADYPALAAAAAAGATGPSPLMMSHDEQLARFEAAGFSAATVTAAAAGSETTDINSFSIMEDSDDDDDFDSFLENVQAQAMKGNDGSPPLPQAATPSSASPNLSAASKATPAAADEASPGRMSSVTGSTALSPTAVAPISVIENDDATLDATRQEVTVVVDDDDFTSFEDSVS